MAPSKQAFWGRLKSFYFAPFRAIGFFWRTYQHNRQRLAAFLRRPRVKQAMQALILITAISWVIIWVIADDQQRNRLSEAVRDLYQNVTSFPQGNPDP